MEDTNPLGKSLNEIMEAHKNEKINIVLVAAGEIDNGHHRLESMIASAAFLVIREENLLEADRKRFFKLKEELPKTTGELISELNLPNKTFQITRAHEMMFTPEISIKDATKPWYHSLPDKRKRKKH